MALEALEDDSTQDDINAIIETLPEADITEYDLRAIRRELERDMKTLDRMLEEAELVQRTGNESKRDVKLSEVKALLERAQNEVKNNDRKS